MNKLMIVCLFYLLSYGLRASDSRTEIDVEVPVEVNRYQDLFDRQLEKSGRLIKENRDEQQESLLRIRRLIAIYEKQDKR